MNESKHDRFCRVTGKRMEQLRLGFKRLGNCASTATYDYTKEEVDQIIEELEQEIMLLREKFSGRKRFSLRDD